MSRLSGRLQALCHDAPWLDRAGARKPKTGTIPGLS
jgi:hypothetical protein